MTDYLELPGQEEDALLEQAKRLERALSSLVRRAGENGEEHTDIRQENRAGSGERPEWKTQETQGLSTSPEGEAERAAPLPEQTRRQSEEGELFLLEQLKKQDRVWFRIGENPGAGGEKPTFQPLEQLAGGRYPIYEKTGRVSHGSDPMPLAGGKERLVPGGRELLPSVGELTLAERADRAFRRDSRRYDGGFYLY